MKVPFAEIPAAGSQYTLNDAAWLTSTGLRSIAPVKAELALQGKGDRRAEVEGMLRTVLRLTCDRCLAEYDFPVDAAFHLVLEVPDDEMDWSVNELDGAAELDVIEVDEPVADLEDILRQQLFLSLPVKQLCSPDCQGLCPHCGAELDSGCCACSSEVRNSPFAALAALKKH